MGQSPVNWKMLNRNNTKLQESPAICSSQQFHLRTRIDDLLPNLVLHLFIRGGRRPSCRQSSYIISISKHCYISAILFRAVTTKRRHFFLLPICSRISHTLRVAHSLEDFIFDIHRLLRPRLSSRYFRNRFTLFRN